MIVKYTGLVTAIAELEDPYHIRGKSWFIKINNAISLGVGEEKPDVSLGDKATLVLATRSTSHDKA